MPFSMDPDSLPDGELLLQSVQPDAAIAFWQWRAALTLDEVKKLADGAAERAFYVTGLAERDAVQLVKDALQEALQNGETLADFKARVQETIASQGWHDSRVETIFRNNQQAAYAAGRWSKIQQVKKHRPYLQYIVVDDDRLRPEHGVLANLVYPADHDFWKENYPPNGHKCRCGTRTLSQQQVEEEGLTVESEMPGDSIYTDPKTGMEYHVARPGAGEGWRNNPGQSWLNGLDLEKYNDLTPESYAEQRLRPNPVATYDDLCVGIQEKCSQFMRNSDTITRVDITRGQYFMATNSSGHIAISVNNFATPKGTFNPAIHIKKAWNNLAAGKKLGWMEEYSMESLWHEIVHNRQKYGAIGGRNAVNRQILEIVTQWSARRTYPDFLKALGGKAAHLESIKNEGLGYGHILKNFDRLLGVLKVEEKSMLREMTRLIDTIPRNEYQKELSAYLSKHSGIKKSTMNDALKGTKYSESSYEYVLRSLNLIE